MASAAPYTYNPADYIFSDTMELTNYLHRRAQEVSNKFHYGLFKSLLDESPRLSLGFSPNLARDWNPHSQPHSDTTELISTDDFSTEGGISQENIQEKHGCPETHSPCLDTCTGMAMEGGILQENIPEKHGFRKMRVPCLNTCTGTATVPGISSIVEAHCISNETEQSRTFGKVCKEMELCSIPSCKSIEDTPLTPCPHVHHDEKSSLSMKLQSLQHHTTLNAEDGVSMQQSVDVHQLPPMSEDIMSREIASRRQTGTGWLKTKENCVVDMTFHDAELPSARVGVEVSSVHSLLPCSLPSLDSSACDNCKLDAVSGHLVADMEEKPKEMDAMSEARYLENDQKADVHEEGKMVVKGAEAMPRGMIETKNEAWGLLLDAIEVKSEEGLVQLARPCPFQEDNEDGGFFGERKEALAAAKVFHRTKRAQPHVLGKGDGNACLISSSCHDMARDIVEMPSTAVSLPAQNFTCVRKRIHGRPKTHVKAMSSLNSVVRFKSLRDVSDMEEKRARVSSETEEHVSNQEKRVRLLNRPRECKERKHTTGDVAVARDVKDVEEQRPRRARSQVLPNKFSDSVLQPWRKSEKRKA